MTKMYVSLVLILLSSSVIAGIPANNIEFEDKCYSLLKPHIEGAKVSKVSWNRYGDIVTFSLSKNVGGQMTSLATCSIRNGVVVRTFESKEEAKIRYANQQKIKLEEDKKLDRFK